MEFPLKPSPDISSLELVRQSAAVLLEGTSRDANDRRPFAAPMPRHASRLLSPLNDPKTDRKTLGKFVEELKATAHLPPKFSRALRAVQLAILGILSFLPWSVLFGISAFINLIDGLQDQSFVDSQKNIAVCRELLHSMNDHEEWTTTELSREFVEQIEQRLSLENARVKEMYPGMTVLENLSMLGIANVDSDRQTLVTYARKMLKQEVQPATKVHRHPSVFVNKMLLWPFIPAFIAFLSKGLLIRILFGMSVVRTKGGMAKRRQHALKAFVFWIPFTLLNCAVIWIRSRYPEAELAWELLWWSTLALIPAGVGLAMLNPDRSPLDRLAGTWLVPG